MATEILMPALSPTMEEGTLAKWLVSEGDTVKAGDIMAEIETDKATMEFEAVDEGTIGRILIGDGTSGVKVNTPIAMLLDEGEDASTIDSAAAATPAKEQPKPEAKSTPAEAKATSPPAAQGTDQSPDWPEGTETEQKTVREALNTAMAEEMRRDDTVFIMGEEVAEYVGAGTLAHARKLMREWEIPQCRPGYYPRRKIDGALNRLSRQTFRSRRGRPAKTQPR